MKHFLIQFRRTNGSEAEWHAEIAQFVAALDNDPELAGKITYRSMKARDGADYYHVASAADDAATKALQGRAFFTRYKERTGQVAAGAVEVLPLEIVAETKLRA
jgi:hypothetical protein